MTSYVDGIPIVKDQTYIGDFETTFKDLAAFGEFTAHLTQAWSLTGGTRRLQADRDAVAADRAAVRRRCVPYDSRSTPPIANISLSDSWRKALWKVNSAYQLDKQQPGLCHLVAGLSPRRRQRAAARRAALGYTTPPGR